MYICNTLEPGISSKKIIDIDRIAVGEFNFLLLATVSNRTVDERVTSLLSALSRLDKKLTGVKDDRTFIFDSGSILYIESVNKKTFAYSESEVAAPQRLY